MESFQHGGRFCETQKFGFVTREQASYRAEAMMDAGMVRPGCHVEPYRCNACGFWHVGNRLITFTD